MTSPLLAQDSPYGRLYRHPFSAGLEIIDIEEAIANGVLMPSVTNVIGIMDKPFLSTWYGRKAAEDAIRISRTHPGLMQRKPYDAVRYLKDAAKRSVDASSLLGSTVHDLVEEMSLGGLPEYDPDLELYIESWREFVAEYKPEFLYTETTSFGKTKSGRKYAGTADFIAKINGLTVLGDYKTGRSIHTEAGIQISALSHAEELITVEGEILEMPHIDAGIVVHLTPKGFNVHQTQLRGLPWGIFQNLREVWDFHVANLDSKHPLLMTGPLKSSKAFGESAKIRKINLASGILGEESDAK
jgi:hypothetical protein